MKKEIFLFLSILLYSFIAHTQTVNVSTATQLQNAINAATPGQTIVLADGIYIRSGGFYVNAGINGTAVQPITLMGNANTIISSANLNTGYGFALKGNNYWVLNGFAIYNSKKGLVLDNSHHNDVKNINVNKIGDEGIHLRTYSSFNTVENCYVDSTGIVSTGTGEGMYVGSATSNWATYTGGDPDTCNYNVLTGNSFGAHIASENIDIKEGTSYGTISLNTFDGSGLNGLNSADSWLDMKGNHYTIACNTGVNTIADGLQTHINYTGFGNYNVFSNNDLTVGSEGYGIKITTTSSNGTAANNVVCSNNTVNAGAVGLTNVSTQACSSASCLVTGVDAPAETSLYNLSPNPASDHITVSLSKENTATSYQITDVLGQVKKSGGIDSFSMNIDIQELTHGIYLFTLSNANNSIRFIKQ